MQHYWSLDEVFLDGAWLTIGSFDGVHIGHRAILQELTAGAHAMGLPAVVVTFHPHPAVVLRNRQAFSYLTTPEERAFLLGELGADIVITHPFNHQVANQSAYEFIYALHRHTKMTCLCVGHDFALGRGREGDLPTLRRIGQGLNYTVKELTPVRLHGQVVSSSVIRAYLMNGDIQSANELLGRAYQVCGTVIPGDGRGKKIGIPTANLQVWAERVLPQKGVYACRVNVDGTEWKAVSNVGIRPTFENQPDQPLLETHILNFDQDLYGKEVSVSFFARLRDEQRFPNSQALVAQILKDIETTHQLLK